MNKFNKKLEKIKKQLKEIDETIKLMCPEIDTSDEVIELINFSGDLIGTGEHTLQSMVVAYAGITAEEIEKHNDKN